MATLLSNRSHQTLDRDFMKDGIAWAGGGGRARRRPPQVHGRATAMVPEGGKAGGDSGRHTAVSPVGFSHFYIRNSEYFFYHFLRRLKERSPAIVS